MQMNFRAAFVLGVLASLCPALGQSRQHCPGVILSEITSWLVYTSDPCILVLSNGDYLVSHAQFGFLSGSATSGRTQVFRSSDKGVTWTKVNGGNDITGILRGTLFEHGGVVYMLGSNHDETGATAVMLRSLNNGDSWTQVSFSPMGGMATPDNALAFNGRLWLTSTRSSVSAPLTGADLFQRPSWTVAGGFPSPENSWLPGTGFDAVENFIGEGQTVVAAAHGVSSLAKVRLLPYFTVSRVNPVTGTVHFDPDRDFVSMPGGEKKFGVRYDEVSGKYFMLANPILAAHLNSGIAIDLVRNTAAVYSSRDLRNWRVEKIFLYSPNVGYEGFQYFNFDFDGEDMVVASRTAFDVGNGRPPRGHDSNLITFHRIPNFRNLTRDHVLKLEGGVARRHEKTQHRDAPLGAFALGTSFGGAPLSSVNGFAESGGEVYLREVGGRILRFDLDGNFLGVVGSAPVAFQTTELALPQPTTHRSTWVASGSGSWDEPRNWHYLNRPGTGEDAAVFGSAATGANATVTIPARTRRWDFNTDANFERWTVGGAGQNMQVLGGALRGNLSATGTGVTLNRTNLNFSGDEVRQIRVRLRINASGAVPVRFFWGTVENNSFAAARRLTLNYTGNGEFQELVFEPPGHAQWDGRTITRIRVDPLSSAVYQGVAFEVDYVSVPADSDGRSLAALSFLGPAAYTLDGAGALRIAPVTGSGRIEVRGGNHTVAVPIGLDADAAFDTAPGSTLTLSGPVDGASGRVLVKTGAGTLSLTANNSFTGTVEVREGALQVGTGSTGGMIPGNVVNSGLLHFNRSDAFTYAGAVSGNGSLRKSGAGTMTLTGANSHTGGTTIAGGTLQVGSGTAGSLAGHVVNNATLAFGRSDTVTFTGNISGSGGIVKSNTGTCTLSGNLSYAGSTTVTGGRLVLMRAGLSDTAPVSISSGAVLQLDHGTTDAIGELWTGGGQLWRGVWGAPGSSAPHQSASLAGAGLLEVTSGPGVPFAAWATASGLTGAAGRENGALADPDGDGLSNAVEWLIGGNPLATDAAALAPRFGEHDASRFHFTFQRADWFPSDAGVFVEHSTTLSPGGWTGVPIGTTNSSAPGGITVEITPNGAAPDTIRVLLPKSLAPTGRLFARLRVVAPPPSP